MPVRKNESLIFLNCVLFNEIGLSLIAFHLQVKFTIDYKEKKDKSTSTVPAGVIVSKSFPRKRRNCVFFTCVVTLQLGLYCIELNPPYIVFKYLRLELKEKA